MIETQSTAKAVGYPYERQRRRWVRDISPRKGLRLGFRVRWSAEGKVPTPFRLINTLAAAPPKRAWMRRIDKSVHFVAIEAQVK